MKRSNHIKSFGIATLLLGMATAQAWAGIAEKTVTDVATASTSKANEKAANELLKHREALVQEATAANDEIIKALEQLKKKNEHSAYKTLADASGKLDVVLARDPDLKMAPIAVRMRVIDLAANAKDVKDIVDQARKALDKGQVQAARALIDPLVSEIRLATDYLPMATYPAAIKHAVAEIQKGKIQEARADLYAALSTIVTNDDIIPLPPLNAEADVMRASQLEKKDRSKNRKDIVKLLDEANQQIALADRLGYGEYKDIKKEIAAVKDKVNAGSRDSNLFGHLENLFKEVRNKV
ncbi:MAG: YfdX family protein [Gammaproteobacteria bacterium]|nr:YfdX family protein [Gammaproteobacteria bacterium]